MKGALKGNVLRRSFAIPRNVMEDAQSVSPREIKQNLNRIVVVALKNYSEMMKNREFEKAMEEMAADPEIKYEVSAISKGLEHTENDGLEGQNGKKR